MKTTISGERIQQVLEAVDWVDTLRSANIKKKIEAALAQPGGSRQLYLHLVRLASFAEVLRAAKVDVEVTEAPAAIRMQEMVG